jgi:hypothetical protein
VSTHAIGPFVGLGHAYRFETSESELADWLGTVFESLAVDEPGPTAVTYGLHVDDGERRVTIDGRLVWRAGSWAEVIPWLLWRINQDCIRGAPQPVVHAGVVEGPHGAIAILGRSGAGKSTITAALVQAGLPYVTDEAVPVSARGEVAPWTKPLALSEPSMRALAVPLPRSPEGSVTAGREHLVAVGALGAATTAPSLPLAAAVLLDGGPGEPPSPVSAATLLGAIGPHVLVPQPLDRHAASTLAAALRHASCWRMGRLRADRLSEPLRHLPFTT